MGSSRWFELVKFAKTSLDFHPNPAANSSARWAIDYSGAVSHDNHKGQRPFLGQTHRPARRFD